MKIQSKYATKVARRRQLYGPGCCAHTVSREQVEAARERARVRDIEERKRWLFGPRS